MQFWTVFLIALALSLDAFATSISCGIKMGQIQIKKFFKIAAVFGLFQAGMPLLGWMFGHFIKDFIQAFDHWIAFTVFALLAGKTFYDAFFNKSDDEEKSCDNCACKNNSCLLFLGIATSIDAFVIGLLFALYQVQLVASVVLIGVVTFVVSLLGCFIGLKARHLFGKWAEVVAGVILLALAIKALIDG